MGPVNAVEGPRSFLAELAVVATVARLLMIVTFFIRTDDLLRGRLDSGPVDGTSAHRRSLGHLLMTVLAFGLVYGAIMGAYGAFAHTGPRGGAHSDLPKQMLYSALKVPLLLLVTFALSLPSFFVLNTVLGVRGDFGRVVQGLIAAQAGLTAVLASLGPLTAFWYAAVPDYDAALLFNTAAFGIASLAAQRLLRRSYRPLAAANPRHRILLQLWIVIYAFVGIQMAWVLRPFIGDPLSPTGFFRHDAWGNAYEQFAHTIARAVL
jgi:hypothetical protein